MCLNEIGLHAPKMYTILSSVVNIIGQETYIPIDEHKNLHFDNEEDIHVTPKTLYDKLLQHNSDTLTILYQSHVSYRW
jgi:hypothetical protein